MKTIIRLIILIVLFAIAVNAQSNPPAPSAFVSSENKKEHTSKTANKASAYNCGTEQNPIFIKEVHTEPSATIRNAESKDREQKASYERWTSLSTIVIAFFTVILGISTVGLWIVTVRAAKHTEKAANAAKDSADALPIIERAYVFVEEIIWQNLFVDEPIQPVTNYLSVRFINHGNTPAIIRKVFVLADKLIVYPISIDIGDFKIPEGIIVSSRADKKSGVISIITSAEEIKKIRDGTLKLICYGCIIYEDILRKERRTYFCWEYNESIGGFYISGNKELNYYT